MTVHDPELAAEAVKMRNQGIKYQEIADTLHISISTAHRYVKGPHKVDQNNTLKSIKGACNKKHYRYQALCGRDIRHKGCHLANIENKGLIFW